MRLLAATLMTTVFLLTSCIPPATQPTQVSSAPQAVEEREPQVSYRSVTAAAFSPDNKLLLTGYSIYRPNGWFDDTKVLTLWDVSTGKPIRYFDGHRQGIHSCATFVAFLPDGKQAVSAGQDGTFKIWDIVRGTEVLTFVGPEQGINVACLSRDGKLLLSKGWFDRPVPRDLKLWSIPDGKLIRTFDADASAIRSLSFSPDGTLALIGYYPSTAPNHKGGRFKLLKIATGETVRSFEARDGWLNPAALSPDGKLGIAIRKIGERHLFALWEVPTGKEVRSFPMLKPSTYVLMFSADSRQVFSTDADKRLRRWDVVTGKEIWSTEVGGIAAISPDTKLALETNGRDVRGMPLGGNEVMTLQLRDLTSGRSLRPLALPRN